MRSYRGPKGTRWDSASGPGSQILGTAQTRWFKRELTASRATWKVIAADLPIGLIRQDAIAQADGSPLGSLCEIANILAFIKHAGVTNTVWITADMHYTAAHYYDPNRAEFQDFDPFWEFVSGPIHAGTWGPVPLETPSVPRRFSKRGAVPSRAKILLPALDCNSSAMSRSMPRPN